MQFRVHKYKNRQGKKWIKVLINNWLVCDIPAKRYSDTVASTIQRAYRLGWAECSGNVKEALIDSDVPPEYTSEDEKEKEAHYPGEWII